MYLFKDCLPRLNRKIMLYEEVDGNIQEKYSVFTDAYMIHTDRDYTECLAIRFEDNDDGSEGLSFYQIVDKLYGWEYIDE